MNTSIKKILQRWTVTLEKYGRLDNWKLDEHLSLLGNYIRSYEDSKTIRNLIRDIRDLAINQSRNNERLLNMIKNVLSKVEPIKQESLCYMTKVHNTRIKKAGQESRFKGETRHIFEERLRFKDGMLLRNFDIDTENTSDSRKVRRIIEKRMCQAYHRRHKRSSEDFDSNKERYWMKRATAFQLYNIGQMEHVKFVSRGMSTHWKRMFDPQTGEIVFKKKMAYSSLEDAKEAVVKWKIDHPLDHREVHAYQCIACGKWHIGHASLRINVEEYKYVV